MNPPALAKHILITVTPVTDHAAVLGDLEEEYAQIAARDGESTARRWYWSQALRSIGPMLGRIPWLNSIRAVVAGYVVLVAMVMLTFRLIGGRTMMEQSWISLLAGIPAALVAGYLAEAVQRGCGYALCVITFLMSAVSAGMAWGQEPVWYSLALAFIGPACVWVGGRVRSSRLRTA